MTITARPRDEYAGPVPPVQRDMPEQRLWRAVLDCLISDATGKRGYAYSTLSPTARRQWNAQARKLVSSGAWRVIADRAGMDEHRLARVLRAAGLEVG